MGIRASASAPSAYVTALGLRAQLGEGIEEAVGEGFQSGTASASPTIVKFSCPGRRAPRL